MNKKKGFTLIELLVTMTIIAVLAALALVSLQGARRSARDAKRKADLEEIRSALEMCYSDTGEYPSGIDPGVTCGASYLDETPQDPATGDPYYYSCEDPWTTYELCAILETGGTPDVCAPDCPGCNYRTTNP